MELATDIVFRKPSDLQAIYERLTRTAITSLKPDNIATFLGPQAQRQLPGRDGQPVQIRARFPVNVVLRAGAQAPAVLLYVEKQRIRRVPGAPASRRRVHQLPPRVSRGSAIFLRGLRVLCGEAPVTNVTSTPSFDLA